MKIDSGAVIKKNKRYSLWRIWNQDLPKILYIMLNPSMANHIEDDSTVRRLNYFTQKFGFGGFYVGNIYPHITPCPKFLYSLNLTYSKKNWFYLNSIKLMDLFFATNRKGFDLVLLAPLIGLGGFWLLFKGFNSSNSTCDI